MPTKQPEFRMVMATAGSAEQASTIARALVERRLAACVKIVAETCSVYHWQGEVHEDEEKLLLIKTSRARFQAVHDAIHELHTYDVPEVLELTISDGSERYLAWMRDVLSSEED